MPIRMAVFDLAGTVVWDGDNAVAGRLCDALRAGGFEVGEAEVNPVMGMPKPLAVRTLMGDRVDEAQASKIHADFQRRIIEHYRNNPQVREIRGASELFRQLRAEGVRIAVDTGFDRPTLDTIVDRLGWRDLIDDTVGSDEVTNGRPSPEMIEVLMARAGVSDPSEAAKIGDSQSDLEQGERAGCGVVIAILNERTRAVLDRYPGATPVETLEEVMPILRAHGLARLESEAAR